MEIMIMADGREIIKFIYRHYEIFNDLFQVQREQNYIPRDYFARLTGGLDNPTCDKFINYRLVKEYHDGHLELRKRFYDFFSFIRQNFSVALPERMQKFYHSLSQLHQRLVSDSGNNSNHTLEIINNMVDEIREFIESVESSSEELLNLALDLKANPVNENYQVRVEKAAEWTETYIKPLSLVLDVNHTESVASLLFRIQKVTNNKRLFCDDRLVQNRFETLYQVIINGQHELRSEGLKLTRELLPLIERLKTESMVLTGFLLLLKMPDKFSPPSMVKRPKFSIYSENIGISCRELFESSSRDKPVTWKKVTEEPSVIIFDRNRFKSEIIKSCPIENYFEWCHRTLLQQYDEIQDDHFLQAITILFDNDFSADFISESISERVKIKLNRRIFHCPNVRLNHELSKKA